LTKITKKFVFFMISAFVASFPWERPEHMESPHWDHRQRSGRCRSRSSPGIIFRDQGEIGLNSNISAICFLTYLILYWTQCTFLVFYDPY